MPNDNCHTNVIDRSRQLNAYLNAAAQSGNLLKAYIIGREMKWFLNFHAYDTKKAIQFVDELLNDLKEKGLVD